MRQGDLPVLKHRTLGFLCKAIGYDPNPLPGTVLVAVVDSGAGKYRSKLLRLPIDVLVVVEQDELR